MQACGIKTDKSLWCWGKNNLYQLGDNTVSTRNTPTAIGSGTWAYLSAAWDTTCALTPAGDMWCWGSNTYGTTASVPATLTHVPTLVVSTTTYATVAVGEKAACGVPGVPA